MWERFFSLNKLHSSPHSRTIQTFYRHAETHLSTQTASSQARSWISKAAAVSNRETDAQTPQKEGPPPPHGFLMLRRVHRLSREKDIRAAVRSRRAVHTPWFTL